MRRHLTTRRKVVLATGALAIGGTSVFGSQNTAAVEVDAGEFKIEDQEYHSTVESVEISVDTAVSYESSIVPDSIELSLMAGRDGYDRTEVGSESIEIDTDATGTKETTIKGNVLESASVSTGDFELLTGQSQRHVDLAFELVVELLKDGESLASQRLSETATVIVKETTASLELKAEGTLVID